MDGFILCAARKFKPSRAKDKPVHKMTRIVLAKYEPSRAKYKPITFARLGSYFVITVIAL